MNNNHQDKDKLTVEDVMILFILKAPDMGKATAALLVLVGHGCINVMMDYKDKFKSLQDWRNHLAAALDNAQEKIDAERKSAPGR